MEDELNREIRQLRDRTERIRGDFLKTEIQTCQTALDMGFFELSTGHRDVAAREVAFVEAGIRTIRRFLPETPEEQRAGFETNLAKLEAALDPLKAKLAEKTN